MIVSLKSTINFLISGIILDIARTFCPENKMIKLYADHFDFSHPNAIHEAIGEEARIIDPYGSEEDEMVFSRNYDHASEYVDWTIDSDTGEPDWCTHGGVSLHLMDMFSGQEDKMPIIMKEFASYIKLGRDCAISKIMASVDELKKLDVLTERIYVPTQFSQALPSKLFGMLVLSDNSRPRAVSGMEYGRFVPIDLEHKHVVWTEWKNY